MKKIWLLFASLVLAVSCGKASTSSKLDIVNGYVQDLEKGGDARGLSFLVGYRLGDTKSRQFNDAFCTGFRYGYQSIITAAHCIESQYPGFREASPLIEIVTGTTTPFRSTEAVTISIHPDYGPNCLDSGFQCPDLAIIHLPDSFAKNSSWIEATDPAEIDWSEGGFPSGNLPSLAGFGCTVDDFFTSGGCSGSTFYELTYSIATGLFERKTSRLDTAEYYFQIDGKNSVKADFGIGSGDSGAPLFRLLKIPIELQANDTKRVLVDGMGIYHQGGFSGSLRYDNLILDFGHRKISSWMMDTLAQDGLNLKKEGDPQLVKDTMSICNPGIISTKPEPLPMNFPPWTITRLGGTVPQDIVDGLNSLRNGPTRLYLGMCVKYVEGKVKALEQIGSKQKNYEALSTTYQMARWEYLTFLELALQRQTLDDTEYAILEYIHQIHTELILQMQNVILSGTPFISTLNDAYILKTGEDIAGPVSDLEYEITAATLLVPGILKTPEVILKSSSRTLEMSVKVAARLSKYGEKAGVFSQKLASAATRIKGAETKYFAFIDKARKLGLDSASKVRAYVRVGKVLEPACNLINQVLSAQSNSTLDQLLRAPLWIFEGTAYADAKCGELTERVTAKIYWLFKDIGDSQLESTVKNFKVYCVGNCNVETFIEAFADVGSAAQLEEVFASIKKAGLKDSNEIMGALKNAYTPHNVPTNRHLVLDSSFSEIEKEELAKSKGLYDEIINSLLDCAPISKNTGYPVEIIKQVKKHHFLSAHSIPISAEKFDFGFFEPASSNALLWNKAAKGTLSANEKTKFERFIAHEYVESRLMEKQMPYRSSNPKNWKSGENFPTKDHFGAHDLAPLIDDERAPFSHWSFFDLPNNGLSLNGNLSNLDSLVEEIVRRTQK